MRKAIYKVMLSIDNIPQEEIEWDKVTKYAPKQLFTDEFLAKYENKLVENDIIKHRPKISMTKGITKKYIDAIKNLPSLTKGEISTVKSIIKKIDSMIGHTKIEPKREALCELLESINEIKCSDGIVIPNTLRFIINKEISDVDFIRDNIELISYDSLRYGSFRFRKSILDLFKAKYPKEEAFKKFEETMKELYEHNIITLYMYLTIAAYFNLQYDFKLFDSLSSYEKVLYERFLKELKLELLDDEDDDD